jgi:hypothetical protein
MYIAITTRYLSSLISQGKFPEACYGEVYFFTMINRIIYQKVKYFNKHNILYVYISLTHKRVPVKVKTSQSGCLSKI